jgi:Uncharacterised nucleotidyltransferase
MIHSANDDAICPEKQLLLCVARTRVDAATTRQISQLVHAPLDWEYVLNEAVEHSVGPLLDMNLRSTATNEMPAAEQDRLRLLCRGNTVRCLFLAAELHKVLQAFRQQGIVAIPYKGPVLAEQAYGSLTLRDFDDLDIILPQRDVPKAHEVMLGLGYQARFPKIAADRSTNAMVPGEYNYRDEKRRAMVELHTELTMRHFPVRPDLDRFAQQLVSVSVASQNVVTFAPEDLLSMLCVHGAKDFWERISWVADVSELVQRPPTFDWDTAFRTAESLGAERMLNLGLELAAQLLQAPIPVEFRQRTQSDTVAAALAREIVARLSNRNPGHLTMRGRLRYRRRMVRGRLAGWLYTTRLAAAPAEEDWELLRLPRVFAPLYLALRPLRLLHKYGWTGRDPDSGISP